MLLVEDPQLPAPNMSDLVSALSALGLAGQCWREQGQPTEDGWPEGDAAGLPGVPRVSSY